LDRFAGRSVPLRKKNSFHLIVLRSTVLPGTAEKHRHPELEKSVESKWAISSAYALTLNLCVKATAVGDFLEPAITIIGTGVAIHGRHSAGTLLLVPGRIFETTFAPLKW